MPRLMQEECEVDSWDHSLETKIGSGIIPNPGDGIVNLAINPDSTHWPVKL